MRAVRDWFVIHEKLGSVSSAKNLAAVARKVFRSVCFIANVPGKGGPP